MMKIPFMLCLQFLTLALFKQIQMQFIPHGRLSVYYSALNAPPVIARIRLAARRQQCMALILKQNQPQKTNSNRSNQRFSSLAP
jgi:multidrug efflux pump subunit AcrB